MLGGKRRERNADVTAESHELTALNDYDAGDDDVQDGHSALLGNLPKEKIPTFHEESALQFVWNILVETAPAVLFTAIGLTFSGEVVLRVANFRAIKRVDALYILIPMLNNLKGNLEMNLSSRLSTAANIGDLDDVVTRRALIFGNLSLLQVQALVVSAIGAVCSFGLGIIPSDGETSSVTRRSYVRDGTASVSTRPKAGFKEFMVLLTTAMTATSLSSVVLGSFMCSLVLLCRKCSLNPDNITTPIASCLGDLLTLSITVLVSAVLIRGIDTIWPVILLAFLVGCWVAFFYLSRRNEYTKPLVSQGWVPLFGAMIIESGTGMVLDKYVKEFEGYGLLASTMGGVPGAVGSVLVSRLSTALHAAALRKSENTSDSSRNILLISTLFAITLPVLVIFLTFIHVLGWTHLPLVFLIIFVPTFSMNVVISLSIAKLLTPYLWRKNLDPDTYAIPIQSSLVDLTGQLMLVSCFALAQLLGANVKRT